MFLALAFAYPMGRKALAERLYDYILLADGTVNIVGYYGTDSELVIPDELNGHMVSNIGERAFGQSHSMASIHIPAGVQFIASNVFSFCENLTEFTVAEENPIYQAIEGVLYDKTLMRLHTFPAGRMNEVYKIPDGTKEIGGFAFSFLSKKLDVVIPASVVVIQPSAFSTARGIRSIHVSENNASFASRDGVLFDKSMHRLLRYPASRPEPVYHVPNGTQTVAGSAFSDSQYLKEVVVPEGVTALDGDWIFSHCRSLESVSLPDSLAVIGDSLFYSCEKLTNVSLPKTLEQLPSGMFSSCSSLVKIELPKSLRILGEGVFTGCSSLTDTRLPDGLEEIGEYAFSNCEGMHRIRLPDSTVKIAKWAFSGCKELLDVNLPDGLESIGEDAFENCESIVLWVDEGSLGQIYAAENDIPFVIKPDRL